MACTMYLQKDLVDLKVFLYEGRRYYVEYGRWVNVCGVLEIAMCVKGEEEETLVFLAFHCERLFTNLARLP
jgi:hypothetical protein